MYVAVYNWFLGDYFKTIFKTVLNITDCKYQLKNEDWAHIQQKNVTNSKNVKNNNENNC